MRPVLASSRMPQHCFKSQQLHIFARARCQHPRQLSSSPVRTLKLAFDFHAPRKHTNTPATAGRPIIFMHGLFGSKRNNRSMSKLLASELNRPVYAVDLRNHGDSPHHPRHDYTALGEDVEEFIDEHQLKPAALIGHSMGAKVAMTVALHRPDLVEKLISIDNAPVDAALKSDFAQYVKGMKKIEEAQVQKKSEANHLLVPYEKSKAIREFLITNLVRDESGSGRLKFRVPLQTLAKALDNMADFPYKDPEEVRYGGPTLFVRGIESHYVADDTLPVVGSFFPCFELKDIEAGHWLVSENPQAFQEAAVEFLSDKS